MFIEMLKYSRKLFTVSVLFSTIAVAAPGPLDLNHTINLSESVGDTFLANLLKKNDGIKVNFDDDYTSKYKVAPWSQVETGLANFDKKNYLAVIRSFNDGKDGFRTLVESIEGKTFTPETLVGLVRKNYSESGNVFAIAQIIAMASGAGTLVVINDTNYYYNYGYKSGLEADDVQSGRSFGAGPNHNANDASDVMYLKELEQYLTSTQNPESFYESFLKILTNSDASGYKDLDDLGQTVQTDLMAIYTAELDRHAMVALNPAVHPWENDLAEATFVSIYSAESGKLMKDGVLTNGNLHEFWAKSEVSNRSGIGITRTDRRKLQRSISSYMRDHHSDTTDQLDRLIGKRKDGDLFRALTEYLNNESTQAEVSKNKSSIVKQFTKFLMEVKASAADITSEINQ